MRIAVVGAGVGGLCVALLTKLRRPGAQVSVYERHPRVNAFGFGVIISGPTLRGWEIADPVTFEELSRRLVSRASIHIDVQGRSIHSTGHPFSGISRQGLLDVLHDRCVELGVDLNFGSEVAAVQALEGVDLLVGADGANSEVRRSLADRFGSTCERGKNRFIWLGTSQVFEEFAFLFRRNEHGLWWAHAYPYAADRSTFIVECSQETLTASGLEDAPQSKTFAYLQQLFAAGLGNNELSSNHSTWRQFSTVRNERWWWDSTVLLGDAAHTAHFSVGSGAKLAIEDAIALSRALGQHDDLKEALTAYQAERQPLVQSLQEAAGHSLRWFERCERYMEMDPTCFAFSLLTRSLRLSHEKLQKRDPQLVGAAELNFAAARSASSDLDRSLTERPISISGQLLPGRIVERVPLHPDGTTELYAQRSSATSPALTLLCVSSSLPSQEALRAAMGRARLRRSAWIGLRVPFELVRWQGQQAGQGEGRTPLGTAPSRLLSDVHGLIDWLEIDTSAIVRHRGSVGPQSEVEAMIVRAIERVRAELPSRVPVAVRVTSNPVTDGVIDAHVRNLAAHCDAIVLGVGEKIADERKAQHTLRARIAASEVLRSELGIAIVLEGDGSATELDVLGLLLGGRVDLCSFARGHEAASYRKAAPADERGNLVNASMP